MDKNDFRATGLALSIMSALPDNAASSAAAAAASAAEAKAVQESIPADYSTLSNDVDDLKSAVINNALSVSMTNGKYIHEDTGVETSNDGSACTGYISVKAGQTIKLSNLYTSGKRGACYYDVNQSFMAGITHTDGDTEITCEIPVGCYYIRATAKVNESVACEILNVATGINKASDIIFNVIDNMANIQGKNYIVTDGLVKKKTGNGVTFALNDDGSITLNGTATGSADYYLIGAYNAPATSKTLIQNQRYNITCGTVTKAGVSIRVICEGGTTATFASGKTYSFVMGSNITLILRIDQNTQLSNFTVYPMIFDMYLGNGYKKGIDLWAFEKALKDNERPWIGKENDVAVSRATALYNGIKFDSELNTNEIMTLKDDNDYSYHDGTIIASGGYLYCIYVKYTGTGDSAVNENATVCLKVTTAAGVDVDSKVVAKKGDVHGDYTQNGGAGSPNIYLVGSTLHILYSAYVNSTYVQMHCTYDVSTGTLGNYGPVTVSGDELDNAWIREYYGFSTSTYSDTDFTAAQANSAIATDGTYYYIGWVCGTDYRGRGVIFKTTNFTEWTVFWDYDENVTPVYEYPLLYEDGYLYYAMRPYSGGKGIIGKIDVENNMLVESCYFKNCSSRPAFFKHGDSIYFFTNPSARNLAEIYRINEDNLTESVLVAECYGGYNYPSFAVSSDDIYVLRTNYDMQVTKFEMDITEVWTVQGKLKTLFAIT